MQYYSLMLYTISVTSYLSNYLNVFAVIIYSTKVVDFIAQQHCAGAITQVTCPFLKDLAKVCVVFLYGKSLKLYQSPII